MLLLAVVLQAPALPEQKYWVGHLKVAEFSFAQNTVQSPGPDAGTEYESADLTVYTFNIYQDPRGVVRHELSSMSRNRSLEPGLDVRLFNYPQNYTVSFNKGAKSALKSAMPLPGGIRRQLQGQQILGHRCKGVEMRWDDMNGYRSEIKTWTPIDCAFRDPLLKITTVWDRTGRLGKMQVEAMTDLRQEANLEDSLFRVPAGVNIEKFP